MLSDTVADQIASWRKRRGLNRDQLAEACAKLGMPELTHAAITNIESGRRNKEGLRRRTVSIDELVVLAVALNVPPVSLIVPYPGEYSFDLIPKSGPIPTWAATEWISGKDDGRNVVAQATGAVDAIDQLDSEELAEQWLNAARPFTYLYGHWVAGIDVIRARRKLREFLDKKGPTKSAEALDSEANSTDLSRIVEELRSSRLYEELEQAELILLRAREDMHERGYPVPDLPNNLKYLENKTVAGYRKEIGKATSARNLLASNEGNSVTEPVDMGDQ
ncbi:helix-turn-helix domain-containing protein [Prauserella flavalba]|uniref:helix-turn-helix domain-containing protein n=1 Tax=Prauserella flavalba TaxID=1477506 RepID=UPI0036E966DF